MKQCDNINMKDLKLELAFNDLALSLNNLAGFSFLDGPFVGSGKELQELFKGSLKKATVKSFSHYLLQKNRQYRNKMSGEVELLSTEEYAKKIGKSPRMVRYLAKAGRIPHAGVMGKGRGSTMVITNFLVGKKNKFFQDKQ